MRSYTKKNISEEMLNSIRNKITKVNKEIFVVLNYHSVPGLKTTISKIKKSEDGYFISRPDYFGQTSSIDQFQDISKNYKNILGKQLLLSSFSYFESYVYNVVKEMLEFHNNENLYEVAEQKTKKFISSLPEETIYKKRKLQEYPRPGKKQKYQKYIKELISENYRFPTDLISYYGISYKMLFI